MTFYGSLSICYRSSFLILLLLSLSLLLLSVAIESNSSINKIQGYLSAQISNKALITVSLSPCHLDIKSDGVAVINGSFALPAIAYVM